MPNARSKSLPCTEPAADELPPPDTKRWSPRRKATVVEAVLSGVITIEEICSSYDLTAEEFHRWHQTTQWYRIGARTPPGSEDIALPAEGKDETAPRARPVRSNPQSRIRFGDLIVDLANCIVFVDGEQVPLTRKEYCILELLVLRKDIVVTKEMFLNHLYDEGDEPEVKIIDVFVCNLRKKLTRATGGIHYIETVWGRGYRLRDPSRMPRPLRP
jgi:DNA-binding winged helix-turn-helix (wHTH) protein/transposase-like protein